MRDSIGLRKKIYIILLPVFLLLSCTPQVDINKPLELVWDKNGKKTDELFIFLPGLYDVAEIFKKERFFNAARKAGIEADMVAASVHIDHLLHKQVIPRLEKDVFYPAINMGYKNIWFVGVSLGGLNSLLFYQKHVKAICGVVLLAPYLGDKVITEAIQNAGGLSNWQPDHFENPEDVKNKKLVDLHVQNLWNWTKQQHDNLTRVYLGYGEQDRYVKAHKLFATFLVDKNVMKLQGEHNWKTGRKLWQQQLVERFKTGMLKRCN